LCNVVTLLVVGDQDGTTFVVDTIFSIVIADTFDGIARYLNVIDVGLRRNLTGKNN
jgi:uncharacterized membrane protein YqiK